MSELLPTQALPGTFTDRGWLAPESSRLTIDEAERLVEAVDEAATLYERRATTSLWVLADLLNFSEEHFGDRFAQVTPDPTRHRRSYPMLMKIARDWPHERRLPPEQASIWVHGEVHSLEPHTADELLESYATGELNRSELREEAQALRDGKSKPEIEGNSKVELDPAQIKVECPMCLTTGEVTEEEREAYIRWKGMADG